MKNRIPSRKSDKDKLDTSLGHRSKYWQAVRVPSSSSGKCVKIFIVYEGCAGLARAKAMRRWLAAHFDGKIMIETSTWNFALLRSEQLQEQAALQAAASDIVVISPGTNDELPAHVKNWLETWMPQTQSHVDILTSKQSIGRTSRSSLRERFQLLPYRGGLNLFPNHASSKIAVAAKGESALLG